MKKHILIPYVKYQRLLQKSGQQNVEPKVQETAQETAISAPHIDVTETEAEEVENVDHIIDVIPKRAKGKARALLSVLKDHIQWNERGEIIIDGAPIPNSHISDLIKYTVVRHFGKKQPPIGSDEFSQLLKVHNIPRSLIVNIVPDKQMPEWISF